MDRGWRGGRLFPVGDSDALARALLATLADEPFRRAAADLNRARVEREGDWRRTWPDRAPLQGARRSRGMTVHPALDPAMRVREHWRRLPPCS